MTSFAALQPLSSVPPEGAGLIDVISGLEHVADMQRWRALWQQRHEQGAKLNSVRIPSLFAGRSGRSQMPATHHYAGLDWTTPFPLLCCGHCLWIGGGILWASGANVMVAYGSLLEGMAGSWRAVLETCVAATPLYVDWPGSGSGVSRRLVEYRRRRAILYGGAGGGRRRLCGRRLARVGCISLWPSWPAPWGEPCGEAIPGHPQSQNWCP